MDRVTLSIDSGIAEVALNRPDKRNALDMEMFRALDSVSQSLADRKDVRAVILRGEGPSFCAGLDVMAVMGGGPKNIAELIDERQGPANLVQRVAWNWRQLPMPVIAALHGHVYGGGLQIALGADIRIAHPDAKLAVMEIVWGIIPDMGITATWLPWARRDVIKELTYTGRVLNGPEALEVGLVTSVNPEPLEAARHLAQSIAGRNPHAIRAAKQLLDRAADMDVHEAFELETELQRPLLGSPNQMEASMARVQRRPAKFKDPE
ncbi:MAG: crotonase/enoyl-CoA hydratase family protein [Myxococcota bacterium]|nr:crotonase/enoyl-CoA hydratase family protein [Myxococcota bacterium]